MNVAVRVFAFSVLPVLLAALHVRLSTNASDRLPKAEVFLIYLFILGVGASGLSGFFGHVFTPDDVAESIDWAKGSPFQQEMGFANLALGILGLVAARKRDGFREATVVAVTVVGVGATIVHIIDLIDSSNLAPGNSIQLFANLIKPALLIPLLRMSRASEPTDGLGESFDGWREAVAGSAAVVTGVVGTGFGLGYALDLAVPMTLVAALVAAGITARTAKSETKQE